MVIKRVIAGYPKVEVQRNKKEQKKHTYICVGSGWDGLGWIRAGQPQRKMTYTDIVTYRLNGPMGQFSGNKCPLEININNW